MSTEYINKLAHYYNGTFYVGEPAEKTNILFQNDRFRIFVVSDIENKIDTKVKSQKSTCNFMQATVAIIVFIALFRFFV